MGLSIFLVIHSSHLTVLLIHQKPCFSSFYLNEIVNQTHELIGESFVNNNIIVNIDVKEDVTVYGFKNELSQVILNILTNAKDALLENKVEDAKVKFCIKKDKNFG